MLKNVGIVGFGAYLPRNRIKISEIASTWGKKAKDLESALCVQEKTVADFDEDAVTMAVEAGENAISMFGISPEQIEAIYVGSESHPYAVNPSATIIAEALGFDSDYMALDLEFACKAGTGGMQNIAALLEAKIINYGMVIGTDSAQAKPHDILEYTASSGAASFILGSKKEDFLVQLIDFVSYSSDTPDFWRRDGVSYPSHQGRFTGEPAYFTHVIGATHALFKKSKTQASDFDYAVFHMPNGKFPKEAGKRLGFKDKQLEPGLVVSEIGNPYSASSLLGFINLLEQINGEKLILVTSYGSGAGSDSFIFKTTKKLKSARNLKSFKFYLNRKRYISYSTFLKFSKRI
ncbi:hypothetical protein A2159_00825 [Candidatus Woesebacteria bacterium RBG_13_34_9]|uniref:Uncharacterized protein n=1 Tax=Candidatus Woesebacteria bacterium RBG_13_34_9 TaxID=1802477 RepID=A0A1F7X3A9_9BACT|nr:MAG: hypothetical protein A2159_00825 [Candidatus Woesebacteria bacterium RBG_13_34_9]